LNKSQQRVPARLRCDIFATLFHLLILPPFANDSQRVIPCAYWLVILNHRLDSIASDNLGMFPAHVYYVFLA